MTTSSIVMLNIGGTIFQTSKFTLTRFDGFFKTMVETSIPVTKDSSDAIFIDRSAKHFDVILSYMRDGDVDLPQSENDRQELRKEAQYYLLTELAELFKPKVRYLNSQNDILDVLVNTTRKAVLVIFHSPLTHFHNAATLACAIDLYGDKLDVYFFNSTDKTMVDSYDYTFGLYIKSNRDCVCAKINELEKTIEDRKDDVM